MGRPSKCPECKVLKSVHDFGSPGKNCSGPALAEDEINNAGVPGSIVDIEKNLASYSPKISVRWKGQNHSSIWCL